MKFSNNKVIALTFNLSDSINHMALNIYFAFLWEGGGLLLGGGGGLSLVGVELSLGGGGVILCRSSLNPSIPPHGPTEGHNSPHGQHSFVHVYKEK